MVHISTYQVDKNLDLSRAATFGLSTDKKFSHRHTHILRPFKNNSLGCNK